MAKYTIARLREDFNEHQAKNPGLSAFVSLLHAVADKGYSTPQITTIFNEVMPVDDYLKEEKRDIIAVLKERADGPAVFQ